LIAILLATTVAAVPSARATDGSPSYFPQGWTTSSTDIGVHISDSGSGLDLSRTTLLVDDTPIESHYDRYHQLLRGHVTGLAPGTHTAAVQAADRAGNTMSFGWSFEVDPAAPTAGPGSPTDTISDRTPELVIPVGDDASGIDPGSIELWLDNGILAGRLAATYDPETSTVRYQIPELPRSFGPGQFPLLDGSYVGELDVADTAGNSTHYEWTFEVRTLLT
jgi:hypothetical protein